MHQTNSLQVLHKVRKLRFHESLHFLLGRGQHLKVKRIGSGELAHPGHQRRGPTPVHLRCTGPPMPSPNIPATPDEGALIALVRTPSRDSSHQVSQAFTWLSYQLRKHHPRTSTCQSRGACVILWPYLFGELFEILVCCCICSV